MAVSRAPSRARPEHGRDALISRAQKTARRLGTDRLTVNAFCRETGLNFGRIYEHFDSWRALCEAAGLAEGGARPEEIPADELLRALHEALADASDIAPQRRLMKRVRWSQVTYNRRFGSWGQTLAALGDWAAANAPRARYVPALDALIARHRWRARQTPDGAGPSCGPPWRSLAATPAGPRPSGPPLGFRAMVHAPANEHGVVLLFGMVAGDIGYAVDAVGAAFPDCAARRLVADGPRAADARWEPVRVEFEFRSRHFLHHGHDPAGCDVIICWEDDWPGCPVEVLALREVVAALAG